MEKLIKQLANEVRELQRKLKKSEKRNRNLTNKVRKLKGLDKRGNLGRKQHDDSAKQADEGIRDIQYPHRRASFKFDPASKQLHLHHGDSGCNLQSGEGREDS